MKTHIPGFPRIGAGRELKKALESFWKGEISERKLYDTAKSIRAENWRIQKENGLSCVSVNDFSLYDHVLDTATMFGIVPERFRQCSSDPLNLYFSMARGNAEKGIRPLGMKKWFNTNYHYMVPELTPFSEIKLNPAKTLLETKEAFQSGYNPKPVILGPITLLSLCEAEGCSPWSFAESLTDAYAELINILEPYCEWVQIDEPLLAADLSKEAWLAFIPAHRKIKESVNVKLMIASTCGSAGKNAELAFETGYDAFHTDLTETEDIDFITDRIPEHMLFSAGVVNGRNIWKTDCRKAFRIISDAAKIIGREKIIVAPGSSLMHVPVDLSLETELAANVKERMAFAVQKCAETVLIAEAFEKESISILPEKDSRTRQTSSLLYSESMLSRNSLREKRKIIQAHTLEIPFMPSTTIGSFPQTKEIREQRTLYRQEKIPQESYDNFIKKQIESVISLQEELGLDILVHGEPERNDMVEYFAEYLDGFAFTKHGWVQSYGSRCVKPPIIYGDVSRPAPITVKWFKHAQSLTQKHVKGMLTGPVTILQWSFAREDITRADVCAQIALAIREEVLDLEKNGCRIIQIDEAAFREGLPLKKAAHEEYLRIAVDCFRIASSGVSDATQIHTHMCYSEFNSIISHIDAMDADVISIEAGRSGMKLLEAFRKYNYQGDIGPGVYDIHSPRIPDTDEIQELIKKALEYLKPEQLWINPDCGLKTRGYEETVPSLRNMLKAAEAVRKSAEHKPVAG